MQQNVFHNFGSRRRLKGCLPEPSERIDHAAGNFRFVPESGRFQQVPSPIPKFPMSLHVNQPVVLTQ